MQQGLEANLSQKYIWMGSEYSFSIQYALISNQILAIRIVPIRTYRSYLTWPGVLTRMHVHKLKLVLNVTFHIQIVMPGQKGVVKAIHFHIPNLESVHCRKCRLIPICFRINILGHQVFMYYLVILVSSFQFLGRLWWVTQLWHGSRAFTLAKSVFRPYNLMYINITNQKMMTSW